MQKYEEDLAARLNGNNLQPLAGAEVRVTSKATGLPASLYQDDELTLIPQPIITSDTGYFSFRAADGKYLVTYSGVRFATFTREIILEDPADNPYLTAQELALANGASKVGYGTKKVSDALDTVQGVTKARIKLRDLLAAARSRNPLISGTATGVTLTVSAGQTSGLTKRVSLYNSPGNFTVHGGTATTGTGSSSQLVAFPVSDHAPSNDGNLAGYGIGASLYAAGWEVEFETDSPAVDINVLGYSGAASNFRVIVDGQYVNPNGTTFSAQIVKLDFAGIRKPRRIQFRCMGGNMFGSVNVEPTSFVAATPKSALRACFTGDSYTEYMGVDGSSNMPDGMWCHVAAHLLGWRDVRQVAVGATGYVTAGSRSKIIDQIPRWTGLSPDVVVFAGGYNDPGVTTDDQNALRDAAKLAWQAVRTALPKVPIFIITPWAGAGGQNASVWNKENALEAAFNAWGDDNAWLIKQNQIAAPWLYGTGKVGATNGSGNSDFYISSDAIHPSNAGHTYLGYRAAAAISEVISAF